MSEIKFGKATRNFIAHNDKELNLKKVYNFIKYKLPQIESYIKMNFGLGKKAKVCKRNSKTESLAGILLLLIVASSVVSVTILMFSIKNLTLFVFALALFAIFTIGFLMWRVKGKRAKSLSKDSSLSILNPNYDLYYRFLKE